jgi:hypothetical protein
LPGSRQAGLASGLAPDTGKERLYGIRDETVAVVAWPWHAGVHPVGEGDQGVIKTILSGASPGQIREQIEGLSPAQLRELAVQLAADPDLTVSVITYDYGRQELEVLHTGPPHPTEHTIDCWRFDRDPAETPARTLTLSTPAAERHLLGQLGDGQPCPSSTLIASVAVTAQRRAGHAHPGTGSPGSRTARRLIESGRPVRRGVN